PMTASSPSPTVMSSMTRTTGAGPGVKSTSGFSLMSDILARMRATVLHSPGDIRLDTLPDPVLEADTDAIVRVVASCVCGSDLWPFRDLNGDQTEPAQIGYEQDGIVESIGSDVLGVSVADFLIAPFMYCDNTCAHC